MVFRDVPLRSRLRLTAVLMLAVVLACNNLGDDDGGGGGGTCPEGERLIDGVCTPTGRDVGGRDVAQVDVDAAEDLPDAEVDEGCEPGTRSCADNTTAAVCGEDRTLTFEACPESWVCNSGTCIDAGGFACTPGSNLGCNDANSTRECNESGDDFTVVACPEATPNCLADGMCTDWICVPRTTRCAPGDGPPTVEVCAEDGYSWEFQQTCGSGLSCDAGECLSPCEENAKVSSFLGCDYWAADLDNIEESCLFNSDCRSGAVCTVSDVCEPSAASQQFSISVSNPNEQAVDVTVENASNGALVEASIPAGTVDAIALPRLDVNGTGLSQNSYHITTSAPVTAHQFNPANNVDVFSNDASLLLPSNAIGQSYVVMTWPTGPFGAGDNAFGYATIIAVSSEGPTQVSVTPTVDVRAGGGVNAMLANTTTQVTLQRGDVLSLQTRAELGRDLSGTIIEADQPIVVFAGHECAFIPDEDPTPYCDHIEQQLYPVEAWGAQYLVAKLAPRGTEIDVYRVVAAQANTVLTTSPAVSGVNGRTLGPGEVFEFTTNQSFELTATAPFSVGQYLTGSNYPGIPLTCPVNLDPSNCSLGCDPYDCQMVGDQCQIACQAGTCPPLTGGATPVCVNGWCNGTGVGDPAFILPVPVSQYRDSYIFLTPADYREDWISVVAPMATELTLDGAALSLDGMAAIGDTGYGVYRHDLSSPPGSADPAVAHTIAGTQPFALQVYGYDCDVSYAYPGGLNLETPTDE